MIPRQLSPEVLSAIQSVRFIAQHIKDADKDNEVSTINIILQQMFLRFRILLQSNKFLFFRVYSYEYIILIFEHKSSF
jgi:hypothetical protein